MMETILKILLPIVGLISTILILLYFIGVTLFILVGCLGLVIMYLDEGAYQVFDHSYRRDEK